MRSNRKILFGLSLIIGAFLFYRAFRFLSSLGGTNTPVATQNGNGNGNPNLQNVSVQAPTGRIAQAAVDIPANSIVTPDMLKMVPYTGPSTKGFLTDIESQGAGFITSHDIPANSQLRPDSDFVGHVSQTGIAGLLRPGMRAMIVPIANKPTLHDLVRIGNFIDVLAAFDGQESRSLVENVRVLGVDVSANDYPNVNAAMRGPFKAAPKAGTPVGSANSGASIPGAKANGANPAPAPAPEGAPPAPTPTPTPVPANAPRPDPALILEVTPRQAAAIQLALASNAPLDFLVRPASALNRSTDVTPVVGPDGITVGQAPGENATLRPVSVTKPQIAPYAEAHKAAGGGGKGSGSGSGSGQNTRSSTRSSSSDNGDSTPRLHTGGPLPKNVSGPEFGNTGGMGPGPAKVPEGPGPYIHKPKPVPTPQQTYTIPVYGDGKILRTETVPLPAS